MDLCKIRIVNLLLYGYNGAESRIYKLHFGTRCRRKEFPL